MLRISLSISRERHLARCRVISAVDCFWADGLAHPLDPESLFDLPAYRQTLHERLRSSYTQAYKDAERIARLLAAGNEVVLQLGQTAVHGPDLKTALEGFAALHPASRTALKRQRAAAAVLTPAVDGVAERQAGSSFSMDMRRFVWVQGRTAELPGYIWDATALVTALVPGYGLVKLGRIYETVRRYDRRAERWVERRDARTFWQALERGLALPRCRPFGHAPSDSVLEAFVRLVHAQVRAERVERARDAERFDPWQSAPDPQEAAWDESVAALEQELEREAQAYLALYEPPKPVTFSSAEPVRALGEQVRPVVKTDRQGRRWVLSVERQRQGYLHGWQRAA